MIDARINWSICEYCGNSYDDGRSKCAICSAPIPLVAIKRLVRPGDCRGFLEMCHDEDLMSLHFSMPSLNLLNWRRAKVTDTGFIEIHGHGPRRDITKPIELAENIYRLDGSPVTDAREYDCVLAARAIVERIQNMLVPASENSDIIGGIVEYGIPEHRRVENSYYSDGGFFLWDMEIDGNIVHQTATTWIRPLFRSN